MFLAIVKLARVHQWVKNTLVCTALLTSHRYLDGASVHMSVLAFFAFCAAASAVYALNDTMDVNTDRAHPEKTLRPLASGALPIWLGPWLALAWIGLAGLIALQLSVKFQLFLAAYAGASLAYCLGLKRLILADVMLLAGLYVLRIAAGAAAIGVPLSFWLAAFTLFLFLSLALLKRVIELQDLLRGHIRLSPRAYQSVDLPLLIGLGTAAVMGAAVVLVLYLGSPEMRALYSHPARLTLLLPVVLYAMARLWLIALRGKMHSDPVVHALRDPASYLCVAATLAVVLWAI
jgi:4-hydroxybenzoate polyprenyltransferase